MSDFISSLSQSSQKNKSNEGIFFPEIPDPPPGFDPEADVVFTSNVANSLKAMRNTTSKKKGKLIPKSKVFIIGPEGNEEYDDILLKGISGEVVLGRKEITDLKGSAKFKVYLEWLIVAPKK